MADPRPPNEPPFELPRGPIDRVLAPLVRFLHVEMASGIVLLVATIAAVALANSSVGPKYLAFWNIPVELRIGPWALGHTIQEWINDGLMVIFFFVIGLEVKRELVVGELRDARRARLPIAAALGGMLAPAVFLAIQFGRPAEHGWGIPMATDIAFVVGCMAILGTRVPHGLRIMLLTLAIADDIGAILVIAVGYSAGLHYEAFLAGGLLIGLIVLAGRLGVRSYLVYTILGIAFWLAILKSGVHATIAGVILGLMTPAREYVGKGRAMELLRRMGAAIMGDENGDAIPAVMAHRARRVVRESVSPLEYLEQVLHPWVAFGIVPLFALANAGVVIQLGDFGSSVSLAVVAGLVLGKPIGIVAACWLAVRSGLARLPDGVTWKAIVGAGCLGGIGFTMALFIAGLALQEPLLDMAKVGVFAGSLVSAMLGMSILAWNSPKQPGA